MFLVRTAYYKYIVFEDKMSSIANMNNFIPIVTGMLSRVNLVVSAVDQQIIGFFGIGGLELDKVCSVLTCITNYNRAFLKHYPAL